MDIFGKKKAPVIARESQKTLHKNLGFTASEQYRLLRANIMFTLPEDVKCPVIGVTSSTRGEGKSTTALNLSYILAEEEKRVLLIDGDLRIPSVAKKLGISNAPGLSNLLLGGEIDIAQWQSSMNPNWYILPSGDIPPNPSELLGSSRMEKALSALQKSFDYIVVDLPPVNIVSDAMAIAKNLTGLVVVVRGNYTTKKDFEQCVRQIELSGAHMLGYVMNDSGIAGSTHNRRGTRQKKYYKDYENYYSRGKKP